MAVPVKRIPLVGSLIHRSPNASFAGATDQLFENCFPEVTQNSITGNARLWLLKRTGMIGADSAAASYIAQGSSLAWSGFSTGIKGVFTYINGTTLAVYDSANALVAGTLANIEDDAPTALAETALSSVSNLTLVATKTADSLPHAWFMAEGDVAWTEITDGDYPANQATPLRTVGNFVHLDGYAFIMDSRGNIWNSDLNSLANWTATSYINAQAYPDGGLGVFRTKDVVAGFGLRSIEFFRNVGNATGSPLARITGAAVSISAGSFTLSSTTKYPRIMEIGDAIYFIGSVVGSGGFGVYRVVGTEVGKVSTPFIDKAVTGAAALGGGSLYIVGGMTFQSQQHILFVLGGVGYFAYALESKVWWKFTCLGLQPYTCVGLNGQTYMTGINGAAFARKLFVSSNLLNVDSSDGGSTSSNISLSVRTQNDDYGTSKKKFFTEVELVCDYQSTSGNITIEYSDDDYQTFVTAGTVDSSTGSRRLTRLGSTKRSNNHRRAWRITESVARAFRGELLQVTYVVGET